ncbi:MAG TPA: lipoyl(octanoyl) transferase LipB [Planctomycetota bacterium]|nr:lipoyl(octanoyl) transferase LipB [Planctomycetota bacterium]
MNLEVRRLGLVEFDEAWALQRRLAEEVTPGRGFLLLLEHPPVFTLGKNADPRNILDPRGIPVRRIDRGGDVTYHGPGQLVGYPILDVRKIGVRRFVRSIEDALVRTLAALGVRARRREDCVGVWTAGGKIASIGIRVRRGVSTHGFALNVSMDLRPFEYINPCGRPGCPVTSVERELGRPVAVEEVASRFRLRFGESGLE